LHCIRVKTNEKARHLCQAFLFAGWMRIKPQQAL